jgi:hypothetical protein
VAVGGGYIVEITFAVLGSKTMHELSSFYTKIPKGFLARRSL